MPSSSSSSPPMINSNNKVKPILSNALAANDHIVGQNSAIIIPSHQNYSNSITTNKLDDKQKSSIQIDPTLKRLLRFLNLFGLIVDFDLVSKGPSKQKIVRQSCLRQYSILCKILVTILVGLISSEVVYDINMRQSKLLAEQKRSTPLLTFVIVSYSWLTLIIPYVCSLCLITIGSHLFKFYSKTTAKICNGTYFGKTTKVDSFGYYLSLVLIAFFDSAGQIIVLGVWPQCLDPYIRVLLGASQVSNKLQSLDNATYDSNLNDQVTKQINATSFDVEDLTKNENSTNPLKPHPQIRAYLLDNILGEQYAHSDIGICIKWFCLMIQFIHSYAFLLIVISLADHFANAINDINSNLNEFEFKRLLKQLIVLRDASEQISLMISVPFALIIVLVYMRQIALCGIFIQSTMQPFENWAISTQMVTTCIIINMVFIYCDGLQGASKQTHRLKIEQMVVTKSNVGQQSLYEFLDYLNRLTKSIRITFFNIIAINKGSLVGLYGHILTLTFVTS